MNAEERQARRAVLQAELDSLNAVRQPIKARLKDAQHALRQPGDHVAALATIMACEAALRPGKEASNAILRELYELGRNTTDAVAGRLMAWSAELTSTVRNPRTQPAEKLFASQAIQRIGRILTPTGDQG